MVHHGKTQKDKTTLSVSVVILHQNTEYSLTHQMLQNNYLSAILKDHNSGYITRRTCFTAPPQTKGFRH